MSDSDRGQVSASAAEVYENFFVPALFGQFAAPMLDLTGVGVGESLLDVGCGTGIVAREAADRVGSGGEVVGIDINAGMLDVAARTAPTVTWRVGAAEDLPLPAQSFDAVTCQFAVMFFEDRIAGLAEMARVARPGRRVIVSSWAEAASSPGYEAMIDLLDREVGSDAAAALSAPFEIGTEQALSTLMEGVFDDVTTTIEYGTARFASLDAWLHTDIRGWTLSDMIDEDQFGELRSAAHRDLADFVTSHGTVEFPAPAIMATGIG